MNNIDKIFIEGEVYCETQVPKSLLEKNYFNTIKINLEVTKYKARICGIINLENKFYLFLPKGYKDRDFTDYKNFAKLLFECLINYKNEVLLEDYEYDWLGKETNTSQFINLVEWLINDFKANGIYKSEDKIIKKNQKGKINWQKSIQKYTPYIQNDELIQLDLISEKSVINNDELISIIHNNIMYECEKVFGWLFTFEGNFNHQYIEIDKNIQIKLLQKELEKNFIDRNIELLKRLITYLEIYRDNNFEFVLATPYFYTVWEEMLRVTFEEDKILFDKVPKPYWEFNGKVRKLDQIPDILKQKKENLFIIDAKYYLINKNDISSLPGWSSIVKQMYYRLSLSKEFDSIKNIFLLPKSLNKEIKYIGRTSVENYEDDFDYVYAFVIDIKLVIKSYLKRKSLVYLLNKIENNIKN